MRKIIAWLRGGTPVVLESYGGDVYRTIAYKTPFGKTVAHVYWATAIGSAILNPDGTVDPKSSSCYITRWVKG